MKKHELIFWIIKVPLDFIIIFSCFFIAREIRLVSDLIPWVDLPIQTISLSELFFFALFGASLFVALFAVHSLYSIKIFHSKIKEFLEIIRYWFYFFIFFSVWVYLWNGIIYENEIPRLIVIFTCVIGTFLVILERIVLNNIQYYLLKKWKIPKRKLLLINSKSNKGFQKILEDISHSRIYEIIWYVNEHENEKITQIPYLWEKEELRVLLESKKCDEILFIDSDFKKKDLFQIWEYSRIFGIRYRYITNSFDITKTNTSLSLIHNIPVIELENTPLDKWSKVGKRIFDIFAWVLWLIFAAPAMIIVAICIKIEDPSGPIFFKNRRTGELGNEFSLYKFRYMKWKYCVKDAYGIDTDKDDALKFEQELIKKQSSRHWPLYKIKNDPRKTKIWTFIEKYSIDELPQFFNVVLWNMSLVWPRPHQPREVQKYSLEEKRVLTIKPGVTGMAQVNGREENDFKTEAKLDIFYIENWSILLDLKIILKTFSVILERIKK